MGWFLGLGMLSADTVLSPASALSVVLEVRDLHHDMGIILMYNMSIWGGSWGRDAADGHVFVPDVGVVGHIGPGPPPRSPAWYAG